MSKQHDHDDEDEDDEEENFGSNEDFLDGLSLSDEDQEFLGGIDPLDKQKLLEATAEKVKQVLISQGFEEDELKVMFSTPEEMIEYHRQHRRGLHTADGEIMQQEIDAEANEGPEPEDDYELDEVATQGYIPNKKGVIARATQAVEDAKAEPTKKKPKKKKDAPIIKNSKPPTPKKGDDDDKKKPKK